MGSGVKIRIRKGLGVGGGFRNSKCEIRKLEGIAHAKVAKVGKVYRGFIFIGDVIAHAKSAKDGKVISKFEMRNAEIGRNCSR